ncbi:MAG: ATP-binding protein [Candidatus Nanopelagicales bacterium]|nr:ATP-binding protein [Candidatus Nanopelagicales bacterium]
MTHPVAEAAAEPGLIGLLGGECSGKTTLGRALGKALPARYVPEALREFVDREGRTPTHAEQRAIMRAQMAAESIGLRSAVAAGEEWVVSDPGALMTAIYSIAYFDDDSLLTEALVGQSRYRLTFLCDPAFPWQPDGDQRDGPEHRQRVHDLLVEVIRAHDLDVVEVVGPPHDRIEQALAAIRAFA